MPIFTVYDGSDVTKIATALLAPSAGITIGNVSLNASGAEAVDLYDGSLTALGIGPGLLLTSGTTPGTSNTIGWFGQDNSGISGFANGDPSIDAVVNTVFQTQSYDATTLSFDFVAADPGATSISFDVVFGSDEYPEWVDQFVDCAVVMVNGVNYALFNHDPSHPLSVVSANLAAGYFQDNASKVLPIEYDGVSHVLKIVAPISSGVTNHIKIGIADTGDHIYDSGLFLANLSAGNIPGSGVVVTAPTPCTDGSDSVGGTAKDEYFALLGGDDTCYAGGGDDIVDAGSGNDVVYGGSGTDQLKGGAGNDSLDGGDGIDTAVYAGASGAYVIAVAGSGFTITDPGPTGEGTDALANIEQVKFSDGLFALGAGGVLTPVADPGTPPANSPGAVVITGIGSAGKKLTASVSDPDGISTSVDYQWQISNDKGATWTDVGAGTSSYTISGSEVGQSIRVLATYVDDAAHPESLTSTPKALLESKNGDLNVTLMHLDAPAGASIINPLTTLLQAAVDLGVTPNVAALGLKAALGLPDAIDLGSYDAYAILQAQPADAVALAVEKVAVQVAILTSLSDDDTGVGLALALLNASAAGQTFDLANAGDLSAILGVDISGLSKNQYPQPLREIFDRNKSMAEAIADGGTVADIEAEWQDFLSIQNGVASKSIADLSTHVNQAPTGSASANLVAGIANSAYGLAATDLLQGFSDPEGNTLSVAGLSADKGSVIDNGDGTFTIAFAPDYVGPVELSYMVVDSLGAGVPGSQLLVVAPSTNPTATISAVSAANPEGNSATTTFTFAVTLDQVSASSQTVAWSIAGSGTNPASAADLAASALNGGVLTFAPGEIGKTLAIDVLGDLIVEPDESFIVTLSAPSMGLTIGTASATGTILNDDATVSLAAFAAVQAEGNTGTTAFTFAATLTGDTSIAHTVAYGVTGSGANPANAADFSGGVLPTGIVTFAIGETTKTVTVLVAGDTAVEADEGFAVSLSSPSSGLTMGTPSATGTITNDDKAAAVAAHDDAYIVLEGQSLTIGSSIGVLANDDNASSATLAGGPDHGTLQLAANGGFTYGPTAGFADIDSFTYHSANGGSSADGHALLYVIPTLTGGVSTTLDLLGLTAEEQIAATYIAFFGRGADTSGFHFWVGQFQANIAQGGATLFANIASSFGVSDEAKGLYPFLVDPFGASDPQISAFIDSVYLNMFNRGSDAAGLAYWTGQTKATLAAGQFVGSILVNIMSGAQNTADGLDISTLMGKVAVSLDFVAQQDLHGTHWNGAADTSAATNLLHGITSDPATVLAGIKHADTMISNHV
ncbi:MAG: choice-of-anchor L domain-containing protein [Reyranellaceae bacterium]